MESFYNRPGLNDPMDPMVSLDAEYPSFRWPQELRDQVDRERALKDEMIRQGRWMDSIKATPTENQMWPSMMFGAGIIPKAMSPGRMTLRTNQAAWDKKMEAGGEKYGLDPQLLGRISEKAAEGTPNIPLQGPTGVVTPPPGVSHADAVSRGVDFARQGDIGRYFYPKGAKAIEAGTIDPAHRAPFFAALSATSSDTSFLTNVGYTVKGNNQWMVGDPINTGRRPNMMGQKIEEAYSTGASPSGVKHAAFQAAHGRYTGDVPWDQVMEVVNDQMFMRQLGYGENYSGSPTLGQWNFARQVGPEIARVLNKNSELPWNTEQAQAAGWLAIRGESGADLEGVLNNMMAKSVWETVQGKTTGSRFPGTYEEKLRYHRDVMSVLQDDQGRDLIDAGFGLIVRPGVEAPGSWKGVTNPGTVSGAALGQEKGKWGVMDSASKELWEASNLVHALLLRHDATAYVNPYFKKTLKDIPQKNQNFLALNIGRTFTPKETIDFANAMKREFGIEDLVPIGDHNGAWFRNHINDLPKKYRPKKFKDGLSNQEFQDTLVKIAHEILPGKGKFKYGASEGFFLENDWSKGNAEVYLRALGGKRPGVQARARELLAEFGSQLGGIEDTYIGKGWNINPNTRFWEAPDFAQGFAGRPRIEGQPTLLPRTPPRAGFFDAPAGAP